MTQSAWPFDAGAGANVTEDQWRKMARHWLDSGVLPGEDLNLETFADSTGMQVKVRTGKAWVRGHYYESDATEILAIAAAHATLARTDRVVLRADFTANTVVLAVVTGVAGGGTPALTQSTAMWELPLALVSVPAADASIDAAQVTDDRAYAVPRNGAGGTLGYAEITASPATFTTEVAVAGLSMNVTVAANRRIKITFMARVSNNTAGAGVWAHIKEGADYRGSGPMVPGGTNQPSILTFSRVLVAPAAGAHTYSISVQTANGGTGTLTAGTGTAAFTIPAFILCEDIGAA